MGFGMIFTDFFKSISQFDDAAFRRVVWRGLILTLAVLTAAFVLIVVGLNQLTQSAAVMTIIGETSWLGNLFNIAGVLFTFALSIWLMVPIASAITLVFSGGCAGCSLRAITRTYQRQKT